ncbi:MAG: general secretion pathway protein GspK [Burkholderiales bacterium]|nr:MAG: general secretion pathway protein GspK [Burkholderiales bacterium]
MRAGRPRAAERGAALLLAMLTVTLVASVAAAALWQQWRATEIEMAERQRQQAGWVLTGALDWARLILREDARGNRNAGNADHLGEPWAMPLEEARLSSFLAVDRDNSADEVMQAFLSGELVDMQSRLNFTNLVRLTAMEGGTRVEVSQPDLEAFTRLYELLELPLPELNAAVDALQQTYTQAANEPMPSPTPLLPRKLSQLAWYGVSAASIAALEPHVTVLPQRSTLNLNTANLRTLVAGVPGLDLAQAQALVTARERGPFVQLEDAARILNDPEVRFAQEQHGTRSRFFQVRGRLRLDEAVIEERSLVVRDNLTVSVLWRERI